MNDFVDPLTSWPCPPPPGYRGQLDPEFQRRRAAAYSGITPEDCTWYHTTELPGGTVFEGEWDLRGGESAYLGGTGLAGRSVLEVGPASGYLTFWMEAQGAAVTAFEAGYDAAIHRVPPVDGSDLAAAESALMAHTRQTTNAWWFLHRELHSSARMVHGDLYRLPDDLGRYEVVVLASVLLHVRDGFRALQQVASHAGDTLVVAEPLQGGLDADDPLVQFGSDPEPLGPSVTWWRYSPGAVSAMLWRLGFRRTAVTSHTQRYRVAPGRFVDVPMFAVVSVRDEQACAQIPRWLDESRRRHLPPGAEVARLQSELARARSDLVDTERELEALRATRTFRWTAGMREIYRTVRTKTRSVSNAPGR